MRRLPQRSRRPTPAPRRRALLLLRRLLRSGRYAAASAAVLVCLGLVSRSTRLTNFFFFWAESNRHDTARLWSRSHRAESRKLRRHFTASVLLTGWRHSAIS